MPVSITIALFWPHSGHFRYLPYGLAVHHLRAALVTIHIGNLFLFFSCVIRLDIFTGREIRAGKIFSVTAHLHNHMGTAFFADYIGYFLIFFLRFRCLQVGILQFLFKTSQNPLMTFLYVALPSAILSSQVSSCAVKSTLTIPAKYFFKRSVTLNPISVGTNCFPLFPHTYASGWYPK